MHRPPDAIALAEPDPVRLLALLRSDELDAAIDAGLMRLVANARNVPDAGERAVLVEAQQRLQAAWDARERYRTRAVRLARRQAERDARRAPAPTQASTTPTLPPAAAAALARARAKAGGE